MIGGLYTIMQATKPLSGEAEVEEVCATRYINKELETFNIAVVLIEEVLNSPLLA
jgi:hypothetical protein